MKLYIYDHCPFCVRARMIFGLRSLPFETVVLANDDEAAPIGMIGAKQVPILQKADGSHMGESLDIVRYVDELAGKGRLNEHIRPEVQAWFDRVGAYANKLIQPRVIMIGLPEFAEQSAVDYFVRKKEESIGSFSKNLSKTGKYLKQVHEDLAVLEGLVESPSALNGSLGMEDIYMFPLLRNLTVVRGLSLPPKVQAYAEHTAQAAGLPLYTDRAV